MGFIRVFSFNLFENNDATQCTLALDTTVVRKAATVQLLEREVDRGEARFLDRSRGWGRSSGLDGCGDGGRFRHDGRRTKWRRHHVQVVHDDFNGAVLVGPLRVVMSEGEDDEAVMKIVERVPVGGDNVVREDVSVFAELGDEGWKRAVVRVGANVENRVRSYNTNVHTYCCVNGTNV